MTIVEFQFKLINLQENLMRFAFRLTTNKEDAQDLVQDTFLKALNYHNRFASDSNLKAWTFTIMKNSFINNYHASVKRNTFSDQTKEGYNLNYEYTSGSLYPDSEFIFKELENSMETLHDDLKIPFKMYHEGFKYKEIAETLDVKLGTVKSRIYFARKRLKEYLNG
jgi:RNA polymerase sigma-70 factor, ECF subfamily